jgi:hypothetical protein
MNNAKSYQITYKGKWLSINGAYNSNRFTRTKVKNEYKDIFKPLIAALEIPEQIQQYTLKVDYNSKLDAINVAAALKIFEDCLKEMGVIINDDKRYNLGVSITPNSSLKHNSYVVVIEIKNKNDE